MNSLFFYFGVKPTLFQLLYGLLTILLAIDASISKQHTENRICQKQNSLQQSVTNANLWNSNNPTKLGSPGQFVYRTDDNRINAQARFCDLS